MQKTPSAKIDLEKIKIHNSWKEILKDEFLAPYFAELKAKYLFEKSQGKILYPPSNLIFNAFNLTPFDELKVVILGQDPYHNEGEAIGLSFSVPQGKKIPPSLKNIYKELENDLGIQQSTSGDLTKWAKQGVLLLNAILSVEKNKPTSHKDFGWQNFTDGVIKAISKNANGIIFLLWGNFAKSKRALIDTNKHFILEAAHPSPLARSGFSGCKHFSKTNALLKQLHKNTIDWNLNP